MILRFIYLKYIQIYIKLLQIKECQFESVFFLYVRILILIWAKLSFQISPT